MGWDMPCRRPCGGRARSVAPGQGRPDRRAGGTDAPGPETEVGTGRARFSGARDPRAVYAALRICSTAAGKVCTVQVGFAAANWAGEWMPYVTATQRIPALCAM
ncbi:hypothetical protein ABID94_006614 [Streptomyces sp. PvR018]|nr:hypothetical protein JHY03_24150 [Streptomyces sp. CA-256286]